MEDGAGGGGTERGRSRTNITDCVDSREPDDWVSRLLWLLERSRGEEDGDPLRDGGWRRVWSSSERSSS